MLKTFFACAAMSALIMLSGCAGSYYRGMDAGGSFVSTVMPEVSMKPAEGFETALAGNTSCLARQEDAFTATVPVQVWYGLSAKDGAQLAFVLAECTSEWNWSVSSHGAEYQHYPVLREMRGAASGDPDLIVFVRPAGSDVFRNALGGAAWNEDMLVAHYEWLSSTSHVKLIAEYREAAPAPADELLVTPEAVSAFVRRAQASFTREEMPAGVQPGPRLSGLLPDDSLSSMLGPVIPSVRFMDF